MGKFKMSMESHPQNLRKHQIWLLAARPKTLPAAAATVVVGAGAAFWSGGFRLAPALACLFTALLLQIGANLANDYFDYFRGADATGRLGPLRVTQAGLLRPAEVRGGMWVVFGLAALLGLYLLLEAGWWVLLIGLACIVAAIAYTGGPLPYGYYGLGDLLVFIFFGPVAVCGTFFVQTGTVNPLALWCSLPMGFLITAILVVNNLRDIESDRRVGKRTLAVRLGQRGTRFEFTLCLLAAYLSPIFMLLAGIAAPWALLAWLTLPWAVKLTRQVWNTEGRPLNLLLAKTGQLTLGYALLFALGLVLGA
jgi:1,4-dihydroxy-2-naphthoate octaprenyltransferase